VRDDERYKTHQRHRAQESPEQSRTAGRLFGRRWD
jgi:hypothetical protein